MTAPGIFWGRHSVSLSSINLPMRAALTLSSSKNSFRMKICLFHVVFLKNGMAVFLFFCLMLLGSPMAVVMRGNLAGMSSLSSSFSCSVTA